MKMRRLKAQWYTKLGHLFQCGFGPLPGRTAIGYGVTKKAARAKAKAEWERLSNFNTWMLTSARPGQRS